MLKRGVLGRQLQLYKHHVIPDSQGQGQRRAARQEVTDLRREGETLSAMWLSSMMPPAQPSPALPRSV